MWKEIKNIIKNKMKLATLVAIIILPLIYGGLYLFAFWDPYSQINKVPVAVVNNDNGWDGENLGNELVDTLKEKKAMSWVFTDNNEALKGLENGSFYTIVYIPSEFSKNILNADNKDSKSTYLEYKNREANNFMASKFSTTALNKIQSTLNQEISKRYFDEVFKESKKSAIKIKDAVEATNKIKNGSNDISTSSAKLSDGLYTLYKGSDDVYKGLENAEGGINKLSTASENLSAGSSNLGNLMLMMKAYLADGHDATMSAYLSKLYEGNLQITNGLNSLSTGNKDLKNGIVLLKDGSVKLKNGIDEAKSGSDKIGEGGVKLRDGASELSQELEKSRLESLAKLENKNTDVLSKPIEIIDNSVSLVTNNGTAFAPYFISLSLWVGSMAIFFLIELNGNNRSKIFLTLFISMIQSQVLAIVLVKFIGLKTLFLSKYFIALLIIALSFGMIQYFLTYVLKEAGKFISITLLMFQLTSSGGSYPMETVPYFFQKISNFMPMTYTVKLLREIISGGNIDLIYKNSTIIIWIFTIAAIINLVITIDIKKIKNNLLFISKKICKTKIKKKKY